MIHFFITMVIALRSPPAVNLEFDAIVTQVEKFGTATNTRAMRLVVSEKVNAMSKTDFTPAKNITQGFLCDTKRMFLLEPFFDEMPCYQFNYNHNGSCPWAAAIEGYSNFPHSKFASNLIWNGAPATQWEDIQTVTQPSKNITMNATWVLDAENHIVFYESSASDPHYPHLTTTYTDLKPVGPSTFDLPEDCDDIGIDNDNFNLLPFTSKDVTYVNQKDWIDQINQEATTWVAGESSWKAGEHVVEFQKTLGTILSPGHLQTKTKSNLMDSIDIPDSFDAREQWPDCGIDKIRNQGSCGSCWSFGAVETLEDRYCITQKKQVVLSTEYMVSCDKQDEGCGGGFLDLAWEFLRDTGVPAETCVPYKHCAYPPFSNCTAPHTPVPTRAPPNPDSCPSTCMDNTAIDTVRADKIYAVGKPGDVEAMQKELMTNGPFEVAFWVFSDFMQYKSGVYQLTSHAAKQGFMGGHAVKVVGWGTDAGVDYWTIANSWGTNWGEDGFWRIIRGTNECGIESTPAAGSF